MPLRFTAAVVAALCATAATAVHRGQLVRISVAANTSAPCSVIVRYADGGPQTGAVERPRAGRVAWSLRVPLTAATGVATWQVRCGLGIKGRGSFVVVSQAPATG